VSDRVCVRGCTVRGMHFAACPDFGKTEGGGCTGCVPTAARDMALVCDRCFGRMRRQLDAIPEALALIRSQADPLKAAVYDRETITGGRSPDAPAPVAADLLDAGDALMRVLRGWGGSRKVGGLPPGLDAEAAYAEAMGWLPFVELETIANRLDLLQSLWADLFEQGEDPEAWTVARALARWPLEDRSWWAAQPCPACDLRAVRVSPPRRGGGSVRYSCRACDWEATDATDDGFWTQVFSRKEGATPEHRLGIACNELRHDACRFSACECECHWEANEGRAA
jgi:hypothetical protein